MLDADHVRQLGIAAEKPLVPLHGGADAEKELQLPFQLQFLQQVRTIQLLQLCGLLELLRKELGGDGQEHTVRHRLKYEICPAEPYTAADLNWMDQKSRSTLEMNDPACRPAIAAPAADLDQYDTVFVGFPIWWYVEPRIVDTFLERSDFSGKTVIPFATSGGSGIEKAERSLKSHCPQANWKKGKLLNHMDAAAWTKSVLDSGC